MASEPRKWDGGPDFNSDDSFSYNKLSRTSDLFSETPSKVVPDYSGFYDSEIESLVNSINFVGNDDFGSGEVQTTPYIEFLLGNAKVISELNRAKQGVLNGDFLEISDIAYDAFSLKTARLLHTYVMKREDLNALDVNIVMAKVLKNIQGDIFDFREKCTKEANRIRGE
ncbi:hypothetical protein HN865_00595 [Candidatus Woesearchaeota archaeon]|jgi:UDP-2,3-diacylglucosamine pyrophosphatase LpxH|nr:hypothetical protein [Candidatus Woesearchaeota archaeon]MBT7237338.1 hypothetical protein [Candidatus Woesearchaeota archaeon]